MIFYGVLLDERQRDVLWFFRCLCSCFCWVGRVWKWTSLLVLIAIVVEMYWMG